MKTKIFSALFASAISAMAIAQDFTTVNATSTEISDNLDLRAVASIFGDAANLEDFERKLNDPELQISNLDLNNDNRVDYIRVIETIDRNTHLIVLQSVLGKDVFQDVATIEVERDRNNNVQIQVVGDVYMYGPNYIYEPVYVHHPVIFTSFWVNSYRPYYSGWYWGYYPTYYYAWNPCPVFRYRRNVHVHINTHNHYNYVNVRRSERAVALYNGRRADGYARQYPNRSFQQRHANVANRYELDQKRNTRDVGTRNIAANTPRNSGTRNNIKTDNASVRNMGTIKNEGNIRNTGVRTENNGATRSNDTRNNGAIRTQSNTPGGNSGIRIPSSPTRENVNVRSNDNNSNVRGNASNEIKTTSMPRENRSQRSEANPGRQNNRTEQAPRASRTENTASRGNAERGSQMAGNRQNTERRNSESRR